MLTERDLQVYRQARSQGYTPATALYAVRPPLVELYETGQADGDTGFFDWCNERFEYRLRDAGGDCFCWQEAVPAYREHGDDVEAAGIATISPEEAERMDHWDVEVICPRTGKSQYLGSVCGGGGGAVADRFFAKYVVEVCVELAVELLAEERAELRTRQALLWA